MRMNCLPHASLAAEIYLSRQRGSAKESLMPGEGGDGLE